MVCGVYMGNFSLKCGKAAFKLTFEELINNATQLARCGFQAPLSHSKHNYKTPDCFLEKKSVEMVLATAKETHFIIVVQNFPLY